MDTVKLLLDEKGRDVYSVRPDATVRELANLMNDKRVGAVLIRDEETTKGIVSERDLVTRVLLAGKDPDATRADEIMTRDLVVVTPSTPIREAMAVMTERRCRHLPVLEEGRLEGIVSIGDTTRWDSRDQEFKIRKLHDYVTRKYPG
jgi:CBS domain-containing protein